MKSWVLVSCMKLLGLGSHSIVKKYKFGDKGFYLMELGLVLLCMVSKRIWKDTQVFMFHYALKIGNLD